MEDERFLNPTPIADDLVPKKPTAYDLLMRQSRKMGGLATRTYDVTKEFLRQDVPTLKSESLPWRQPITNSSEGPGKKSSPTLMSSQEKDNGRNKLIDKNDSREAKTLDPSDNLRKIVEKSHQVLAGARAVWLPMNLFPDSVIVDRTKVTITKRSFFWTANVISFRIEDVLNVSTNTGPFFGSLTISSRVMNSTDHYEINYFWRRDAIYLKQLIQGYVIAQHNQIETSHLERDELIRTLLELGQDSDF